ncbi:MAG: carbon-monoxide dehydrogenase large subunit, partial [Gammaproteobacteria bacterium]
MNKPQHGASNWIGQRLVREEDEQFLTGTGCFTDDIQVSNAAHAYFVRSPHAHALIMSIETSACRAVPGVLAVLTADDLQSVLSGPIPSMNDVAPFDIRNRDGAMVPDGSQPVLANQIVRYVGESVAVVVARTAAIAREASELVDVEYEPRHPTMSYDAAVAADAQPVWENLKSNRTLDWTNGREAQCQELFNAAAHVVECQLTNNRIAPCFLEPRAAIASYDAAREKYRLDAGCQGVHGLQAGLAALLDIEPSSIRVVAPDTGGGFGARGSLYPEYAPLLVAARQLGQPVRWTSDRSEGFLTDLQARDHTLHGELALDSDGNFLALRVRVDWRHGAYFGSRNVWVITSFLPPTVGGVYRIPTAAIAIRGAFTNTTPQAAFRGIGRVEANFLLERL